LTTDEPAMDTDPSGVAPASEQASEQASAPAAAPGDATGRDPRAQGRRDGNSGPDPSGGPRFQDRLPHEYPRQDINPYMTLHREFGPPVVTTSEAQEFLGRWHASFGREAPLHVEIGPGNGFHLSGMAALHPERNWLGVEIRYKRVVMCAKKIQRAGATESARIARYDAWSLDDIFAPGEIDALYVFHPDPWSKSRHHAKRLMSRPWAEWMCRALAPGAPIRIKTDHLPHIEAFVEAVEGLPLGIVDRRDDVAVAGYPWPAEDDVITNYESKFHKRGEPIYALLAERLA
jgi:tRNA (guanine-N7-)-methyltransferase